VFIALAIRATDGAAFSNCYDAFIATSEKLWRNHNRARSPLRQAVASTMSARERDGAIFGVVKAEARRVTKDLAQCTTEAAHDERVASRE